VSYDASDLEPLEVKGLGAYGIPNCVIPDQTQSQLRRFARALDSQGYADRFKLAEAYSSASDKAEKDLIAAAKKAKRPAPTEDEIGDAIDVAFDELDKKFYGIIADVCSNVITVEQLAGLPARRYRHFWKWLSDELLNPPESRPATKPVLTVVPDARNAS
jgi:DNA-binding GntR family transcriptional regulator